MEAYLDNSATTRCSESSGRYGLQGHDGRLRKSILTSYEGSRSRELYQRSKKENSKDTESNGEKKSFLHPEAQNRIILAIIGSCNGKSTCRKTYYHNGNRTCIGFAVVQFLEEQGFEVTILPVDEKA